MLLATITRFAKKRKNSKTSDTSRATGVGYGFYHPVEDDKDEKTNVGAGGESDGGGDGGGE